MADPGSRKQIARRQFLKLTATLMGGVAVVPLLDACSGAPAQNAPSAATTGVPATAATSAPAAAPTAAPASAPTAAAGAGTGGKTAAVALHALYGPPDPGREPSFSE